MKTEIDENEYGMWLTFHPETVEDASMLLRFANNAKLQKPGVFLAFRDKIWLEVSMLKVRPKVQVNTISPRQRKKR